MGLDGLPHALSCLPDDDVYGKKKQLAHKGSIGELGHEIPPPHQAAAGTKAPPTPLPA